jgi:hypothetical protein
MQAGIFFGGRENVPFNQRLGLGLICYALTRLDGRAANRTITLFCLKGTLVYFRVANIDTSLAWALAHGGKVLFPKTSNDGTYFVAELADSEGNRVALHQPGQ